MQLSPGTRLGPYEIQEAIGKGGMGEVYKALDTRLNRVVAIKVSAERFSERFEREARAIASLNHPNICTLYDVGPNYLVMEYIEGESPKGPLPVTTVIDYARQMADAFDAAHEKGITHRDLKPGNLKITPEGKLKVLDFGLAKLNTPTSTQNRDSHGADASLSPTLTMGMTQAGMILGTAAYMAPEQAKGKDVDKRADIWSFGVVLYELATGKRLFKGEDVSDILASVLKEEPDFNGVPAQLRPLLRRCLEKDPKKRLRDIADAGVLLDTEAPAAIATKPAKWLLAVAATALLAVIGVGAMHFTEPAPTLPTLRFEASPPEGVIFAGFSPRIAISPDGTQVAFNGTKDGKTEMWVYRLDTSDARALPGTERSETPFWSPDSKAVGFFADGKLKRIDVASGAVQVLCDAPTTDAGGSWSPDGQTILFSGRNPDMSVHRVAAGGGQPQAVLKAKKDEIQRWPRFLPDGKHFLYLSNPSATAAKDGGIFVASLDGGEGKKLLAAPFAGEFVDGYLFYRTDQALLARAFDPGALEFTGEAIQVLPGVSALANGRISASVSPNGFLVAQAGRNAVGNNALVWLDRAGKELGVVGEPGAYQAIALSPDQRQLALTRSAGGNTDIWLMDLARNVASRLTYDNAIDQNPIWSNDGQSVLFDSTRAGGRGTIFSKPASGLGEEQQVLAAEGNAFAQGFSPDGKLLLYSVGKGGTRDIFARSVPGNEPPVPVLTSMFDEMHARFSPDGKWIAYSSDESGMPQIYVRSFPGAERKIQVSRNGGIQPHWRGDGKEIFFLGGDSKMMAAPVKSLSPFEPGEPVALFQTANAFNSGQRTFDVSRDEQRFILNTPRTAATQAPLTVIQNWQALIK